MFPLAAAAVGPAEPTFFHGRARRPRDGECSSMNRVLRILFVEDMPDIQKVGLRLFQAAGHRVYLATNGREAVDIFDREPVDLVVMDLQMPEMDGWQAAR